MIEVKQAIYGDDVDATSHVYDILVSDQVAVEVNIHIGCTTFMHSIFGAIIIVVVMKVTILLNLLLNNLARFNYGFIIAV